MTDPREPGLIAHRLGLEQAARLSAIVGGTRLSVPASLADAARLKRLVGEPLAIVLVLHFGGSRIKVPTGAGSGGAHGQVDVRRVARLLRKGWSNARIARKLHCAERSVERKRARMGLEASVKGSRIAADGQSGAETGGAT